MRTMPTVGAFKMHLALMTLVSLWLIVAEYVLEVPFVVTVVVVAALTLISGKVTSVCVNRLVKHCEQELQAARHATRKTKHELRLVITMLPSLRAMYDTLCPLEANTTYVMYEFTRWLSWALNPKRTNVREWLETCHRTKGTALAALHGVCDELDGLARQKKEYAVAQAGYEAYVDVTLLRSSQVHPEGGGEQEMVPSELGRRLKAA